MKCKRERGTSDKEAQSASAFGVRRHLSLSYLIPPLTPASGTILDPDLRYCSGLGPPVLPLTACPGTVLDSDLRYYP
ncbi:hypothetical protein EVAR_8651_1 [Eumeta japonica]|uniref:Uncharacterized protein n=1 Tax=Eumeta variegata TaxID=151549 RepID=A0A4C1TUF9_EUMVA|nr:hypothetical protein EVAR_8651_1 [Eumeta japonica]